MATNTLTDSQCRGSKPDSYEGSALRKPVDSGVWGGAKAEVAKWVNGGGRVLPGLVARRAAEVALLSVSR